MRHKKESNIGVQLCAHSVYLSLQASHRLGLQTSLLLLPPMDVDDSWECLALWLSVGDNTVLWELSR